MWRYIGRRLLQIIPVFFGATLLLYALVFLMPGDPVEALGGDRGLSEAARQRITCLLYTSDAADDAPRV